MSGRVTTIALTDQQAEQLSTLVIAAAASRQNVLFSVAVPEWPAERGETIWLLQAIAVPARIGHKVRKLLVESTKSRKAAVATPSFEDKAKRCGGRARKDAYKRSSRVSEKTPIIDDLEIPVYDRIRACSPRGDEQRQLRLESLPI